MTNELTTKLENVLGELQDIMEQRHERIAELKAEIARIELENEKLEKQVQDMLNSF